MAKWIPSPINKPLHPLLGGKREQFQIIGEQHRGQSIPLHPQGSQREEQLPRVFTVSDDVQVNEDEFARTMLADVCHHIGHRLLVWLASPSGRHDTEIAIMNASARSFKDVVRQITIARQQFAPREMDDLPDQIPAPGRSAALVAPLAKSRSNCGHESSA